MQHHDTLTGSGIHAANDYTRWLCSRNWERMNQLELEAMEALAKQIKPRRRWGIKQRLLLFSGAGYQRNASILLTPQQAGVEVGRKLTAIGADGTRRATQWIDQRTTGGQIQQRLAIEVALPACGWITVDLVRGATKEKTQRLAMEQTAEGVTLRSPTLAIKIDPASGAVSQIEDAVSGEALLSEGKGARLIDIHEADNGMSAWRLGEFLSTDEMPAPLAMRVSAEGPLKIGMEFTWAWRDSTIHHEIALEGAGEEVLFTTWFDWHEKAAQEDGARLVKFAAPLRSETKTAFYEIPYGLIQRPEEMGEVPALRWAARVGGGWTSLFINDAHHGHDIDNGELRLSLIRSSRYPDAEPNMGWQRSGYALAFRRGELDASWAMRAGANVNAHTAMMNIAPKADTSGDLPAQKSLAEMGSPGMILSALKAAEDGRGAIARIYNTTPANAEVVLQLGSGVTSAQSVNLLEEPALEEPTPQIENNRVVRQVRPFEIVTLRIQLD
jgi:alpha-mannosidase